MKFDVIIGNPPYQELTGGGASTPDAIPLYHLFIENAIRLNPKYISMIIPSRWMSGGKVVLDTFRSRMINDRHIREVVNYIKASDVFDGVRITGGVQYFLWDSTYNGDTKVINRSTDKADSVAVRDLGKYTYNNANNKENYMVIIDNASASIVDKVIKLDEQTLLGVVLNRTPFGLSSDFEDSLIETTDKNLKVICSNGRVTWTDYQHIGQNQDTVNKWKVYTGYKNPDRAGAVETTIYNVINKPKILKPGEVCSMSYLILNTLETQEEAESMISYMKTKFTRFLIMCTLTSSALTSRNFMFIPVQDYSKPWTDEELYRKYNLTESEIEYIESRIKTMN